MEKVYEVVNIYREYDPALSFWVALFSDSVEYFGVDKSHCEEISQGGLCIGDTIRIIESGPDGISYRRISESPSTSPHREEEPLFYRDKEKDPPHLPKHFLPFLSDTLPYCNNPLQTVEAAPIRKNGHFQGKYLIEKTEVTNLKKPLPDSFVARVHQKTRIAMSPKEYNPFFFIIVSSNNQYLKIVFWRESLRHYSSVKTGDVLYVKKYKPKRKLGLIEKLDYCTFTESMHFDCEEVTARELFKIEVADPRPWDPPSQFQTVRGIVTYVSVLMRATYNSSLMEYILCRVADKSIILFYNSDDNFYNIKEGVRIKIAELRPVSRAGSKVYISTIYTQFDIDEESDEEDDIRDIRDVLGGTRDSQHTRSTRDAQGTGDAQGARSAPGRGTSPRPKRMAVRQIFGAVGYLPDYFMTKDEILESSDTRERVLDREVLVNLFMRPAIGTIEDIQKESLIANETRKHLIYSTLVSIRESTLTIDYTDHGMVKKQPSWVIQLDDGFECHYFENFFIYDSYGPDDFQEFIGKKVYFVIESFMADCGIILRYVTGVIRPADIL